MKEIINNIFELNDFKSIEIDTNTLYINCNKNLTNYWLVLECEPSHIISTQSELIYACNNKISDPALEKNINILCLWKIDEFNDDIKKSIQEVEEDSYFFKKHVLYFTEKELNEIKIEIENKTMRLLINEQVTSPEVFEKYKNEFNNDIWQSLLYRIVIKASFIKINKKKSGEISDLKNNITDKLNTKKNNKILHDLNNIILKNNFNINSDPLDILAKIKNKLKENEHGL